MPMKMSYIFNTTIHITCMLSLSTTYYWPITHVSTCIHVVKLFFKICMTNRHFLSVVVCWSISAPYGLSVISEWEKWFTYLDLWKIHISRLHRFIVKRTSSICDVCILYFYLFSGILYIYVYLAVLRICMCV